MTRLVKTARQQRDILEGEGGGGGVGGEGGAERRGGVGVRGVVLMKRLAKTAIQQWNILSWEKGEKGGEWKEGMRAGSKGNGGAWGGG